jgi:hypothetical protein
METKVRYQETKSSLVEPGIRQHAWLDGNVDGNVAELWRTSVNSNER